MCGQTSKERKNIDGKAYAEQKNMAREDEMSHYMRDFASKGVSCDSVPFTTLDSGQSYVQSCAGLTREAEELPLSCKENNWCALDLDNMLACRGYGDIRFCGIKQIFPDLTMWLSI